MMLNLYLGARRKRRVEEVAVGVPDDVGSAARAAAGTDSTDDRDVLLGALAELSKRRRAALVLRFYDDLDDRAIAALLGCRTSTVRSLVARGLADLRDNPRVRDGHSEGGTR